MTDNLRARIAEAIGQHCPDHYEHDWEAAADKVLALIQATSVRLDVHCDSCKSLIGTWHGGIAEKYPFWCDNCGDIRDDKNPWAITATIEGAES